MKKNRSSMLWLLIILTKGSLFCQNLSEGNNLSGKYQYSAAHYVEQLVLDKNGTFISTIKSEFLKLETVGNWQFRNDSIILDSRPQKDKLIVIESGKRTKNNFFTVTDKNGWDMIYSLILKMDSGKEVVLENQFKRSRYKGNIISFKIKDTKGLESPEYTIMGSRSNFFTIFFETARVFENESWHIQNKQITPKGLNGKAQMFTLVKDED